MYDRARRRYYASRFSLFVSYGVNSTATMPGLACVRSLIRKRGLVYDLWPIGLGRYARHALGITPGETSRGPAININKLDYKRLGWALPYGSKPQASS